MRPNLSSPFLKPGNNKTVVENVISKTTRKLVKLCHHAGVVPIEAGKLISI
jgi:hypothetical protein